MFYLLDVLQIGDRVGPVGTGETNSSFGASGGSQRFSPLKWSIVLDRQEALVSTVGIIMSIYAVLTYRLRKKQLFHKQMQNAAIKSAQTKDSAVVLI